MPQLKNKIAVVTGAAAASASQPPRDSLKKAPLCLSPGRGQAEIDKAVAEIGSNATGVKTDIPSSTTSTAFTQIPFGRKTRFAAAKRRRLSTSRIGGGWDEKRSYAEERRVQATQNKTWPSGPGA